LLGSLAAGVVPTLTEETFSAGNRKWNDDAIAYLKFFVVPSDIDDFTHCLVAKHIATFHRWDYAIEYMKVRATNGACRDLDDSITSILDLWIWNGFASNIAPLPCQVSAFTIKLPHRCCVLRGGNRSNMNLFRSKLARCMIKTEGDS
jgi:hypothetical protein